MSINFIKISEEVITEVKEIVDPETKDPIGFHMHKPFRLDIVSNAEDGIIINETKGYQVLMVSMAPLSKE